jgi:hypothetical protein
LTKNGKLTTVSSSSVYTCYGSEIYSWSGQLFRIITKAFWLYYPSSDMLFIILKTVCLRDWLCLFSQGEKKESILPLDAAIVAGQGVKSTTHFHLMLRLRMSGTILLLSLYAFMAWRGTALPFPLS